MKFEKSEQMKRSIFNLLFFISSWGVAQTDSILYTRDFECREDIYLTLEQFRNNDPILPSAIVSSVPKTELNFLSRVLERKKLTYKDKTGAHQEIATANVWGFCRNKTLFINFNQTMI